MLILTMTIQKSGYNYNTTISQCRYGLFAPIQKNTDRSRIIAGKIKYGNIEISLSKVLTQVHQDIILALLTYYEKKGIDEGSIVILYNPSSVLRKLNQKGKNTNWLLKKIQEISDTDLNIKILTEEKEIKISGKIIIEKGSSKIKNQATSFKDVFLAYVKLGSIYSSFFNFDINMQIKNLEDIIRIKHGVVKAFVKYVLTTSSGKNFHFNIPLLKILYEIKAIDENTPTRTLRQLIKYVSDQRDFLKEKFGIIIKKDIVFYYPKNNNVYFKNIAESDKYSRLKELELVNQ